MILRPSNNLIIGRGLATPITNAIIAADNTAFITGLRAGIVSRKGKTVAHLPPNPPFEIHPYKALIPFQEFEKYIIGTFPPINYVYDTTGIMEIRQPLLGNKRKLPEAGFPFYHGNRELMWDYLLTPAELNILNGLSRSSKVPYLIAELVKMQINYGDIIDSLQRKLDAKGSYRGSDNLLFNISVNIDLINHILANTKAKYLLFNTASIYGIQGLSLQPNGLVDLTNDAKAFDLFIRALQELGYQIEIGIDAGPTAFPFTAPFALTYSQKSTKIAFELKVINPITNPSTFCCSFSPGSEKVFKIIAPFSPAVAQRTQLLSGNPIVSYWKSLNPNRSTKNMLSEIYQKFRNGNWNNLYLLNN